MMHKDITGVLICGGQSTRFGSDKRLHKINGKTLLELSFHKLSLVCSKVICVFREYVPKEFKFYPIIFDDMQANGPMAGILAALKYIKTSDILCMPCDMPYVSEELLEYMCAFAGEGEVVLPSSDQRLHPLLGVYPKHLYTELKRFSVKGGYGLQSFFNQLSMNQKRVVYPSKFNRLPKPLNLFENFNFL
jgi:molybdopterin-guanine dinucleotide biosynthesis protein A